jgi:hypothetical protein
MRLMDAYKTLKVVSLPSGTVLALDEKQAATRAHAIKELAPGVYVALQTLQFVAGETIGLELPPPLGETGLLGPIGNWRFDEPENPINPNNHSEASATTSVENPEAASSAAKTEEKSSGGDAGSAVKDETANAETKETKSKK